MDWAGQYGFLFDNVEDTLSFSRFQTFNFHGWDDAPEVLEPLLFYVLHRATAEIADPNKLATFKMFLLDEAWLFINETIRNYVVQAQKTWRKHNGAMILATQSIKEFEESGLLPMVSESCPTKIFLANPEMDRNVYREAFHLNDTELDLIAGLVPPGQMLIRKAQTSKKVQLNVDPSRTGWRPTILATISRNGTISIVSGSRMVYVISPRITHSSLKSWPSLTQTPPPNAKESSYALPEIDHRGVLVLLSIGAGSQEAARTVPYTPRT